VSKLYLDIATAIGSTVCGALAGGLVASRVVRQVRPLQQPPPKESFYDDPGIDEVARQWATEHGHPEAQGLVANKLRLGLALKHRQRFGRRLS
jgi:hypothetical protein